jgi:large subunit ribosomal protein L13e
MVKHNNIIPNIHCHKKYLASSRGPIKVKLALNQASRKKSRRLARAAKAAALAPQPLEKLYPVVHCPTQRYSHKTRLGKGFTLAELKAAGNINPKYAQTVGIAVDHRRQNHSMESLQMNVARLKEYMSKLIILSGKKKASADGVALLPQAGTIQPVTAVAAPVEVQPVTDEMKNFKAFTTLRNARSETRVIGNRIALANRKKKE